MIYSPQTLTVNSIPNFEGEQARVYLIYEEVQVNSEGEEVDSMGGFARVNIDPSLNDNAQGFKVRWIAQESFFMTMSNMWYYSFTAIYRTASSARAHVCELT